MSEKLEFNEIADWIQFNTADSEWLKNNEGYSASKILVACNGLTLEEALARLKTQPPCRICGRVNGHNKYCSVAPTSEPASG